MHIEGEGMALQKGVVQVASRATCAHRTPLVAFDAHSSCGCSSDVAAGAVDVLELPSRAPCWLLGTGARSFPGAHLLQGDPDFSTKCLELFPVRQLHG